MEINWQRMSRKIFSIDYHVLDNRAIHTIGFDIQSKTSKLQQGVKPYKLKKNRAKCYVENKRITVRK